MQTLIMNNDEKHRLILTDKTKILSKVFQWKKKSEIVYFTSIYFSYSLIYVSGFICIWTEQKESLF